MSKRVIKIALYNSPQTIPLPAPVSLSEPQLLSTRSILGRVCSCFDSAAMSNPCTNIPIRCIVANCKEIHWKYNMKRHLSDRHPSWPELTAKDKVFLASLEISMEEQEGLKLPDEVCNSVALQQEYEARCGDDLPTTQDLHSASPCIVRQYQTSHHERSRLIAPLGYGNDNGAPETQTTQSIPSL